jgi:uncharacterized delta-60 repeat protein
MFFQNISRRSPLNRQSLFLLFASLTVLTLAATAVQAVGLRDQSFGSNGRVVSGGITNGRQAIVIQPDGKIVVSGAAGSSLVLVRYNLNGSLDGTFGTGGVVVLAIGGNDIAGTRLALDSVTGKIVAAGAGASSDTFFVARFLPNGAPDTSYSGSGVATVMLVNYALQPTGVAVQSDGKVVVNVNRATGIEAAPALYRFNANGTLDAGFGSNGTVVVPQISFSQDMLVQPDGKLLASGNQFIRRYNGDGSPDLTFGTNGRVPNGLSPIDLLPNGDIFGFEVQPNISYRLRRFKSDGSIDLTFNATTSFSGGSIIVVRSNGEPLVISAFRLYRFAADGTLLASAGVGGAHDLAVQSNGSILTVGTASVDGANSAVTRYLEIYPDAKRGDFDRDRRADLSVFRPGNGSWYLLNSSNNTVTGVQFGAAGDRVAPGDYDGDGRTDIAVFRSGIWYILGSYNSTFRAVQWGLGGDIPVAADYDADGQTDIAVFRGGDWYALRSLDNTVMSAQWGLSTDIPVPGNYDGVAPDNFAVFRPSNGTWYPLFDPSPIGGAPTRQFGQAGDLPVPADYDGNGRTDYAVYRPGNGTWYVLDPGNSPGNFRSQQFGINTDRPIPGDYDADGSADFAVFRDGIWYALPSTGGFTSAQWGLAGDVPVPAGYIPQ